MGVYWSVVPFEVEAIGLGSGIVEYLTEHPRFGQQQVSLVSRISQATSETQIHCHHRKLHCIVGKIPIQIFFF